MWSRRVLDDVGHDPHARLGRVDVGVADHELLEDVVLDGPAELGLVDALLLAGHDEDGQARAAPPRSWSSRPTSSRGGCRRRGSSCPRPSRWPRRPCPRRPRPGGGRSRSPGGWPGRRPPTGPSGRRPGCAGRRRSTPRRWRSRRTGGSSTAGWRTSCARTPRVNGAKPGSESRPSTPPRSVGRVERLDVDALGGLPHQRVGVGALQVLGRQLPPVVEGRLLARVAHAPKPRGGPRWPEVRRDQVRVRRVTSALVAAAVLRSAGCGAGLERKFHSCAETGAHALGLNIARSRHRPIV